MKVVKVVKIVKVVFYNLPTDKDKGTVFENHRKSLILQLKRTEICGTDSSYSRFYNLYFLVVVLV